MTAAFWVIAIVLMVVMAVALAGHAAGTRRQRRGGERR